MLCKWCGMESASTEKCSWCAKSFTTTTEEAGKKPAPVPVRPAIGLRRSTSQPVAQPEPKPEEEHEEDHPFIGLRSGATAPSPVNTPPPSHNPTSNSNSVEPESGQPKKVIALKRPGSRAPVLPLTPPAKTPDPTPEQKPPSARPTIPVQGVVPSANRPAPPKPVMKTPRPPADPTPVGNPPPRRSAPPAPQQQPVQQRVPQQRVPQPLGQQPTQQQPPVPQQPTGQKQPPVGRTSPVVANNPTSSVILVDESEGGLASGIAAPIKPGEVGAPQLGTFTSVKSKYYAGQVIDTVSGNHYDTETGKVVAGNNTKKSDEVVLQWDKTPYQSNATYVGRFLGVLVLITALVGGLSMAMPQMYVLFACLGMFFGGMLLPIMGAVPWPRDDSDDVGLYAGLAALFGPFIGTVIYGGLGMARQSVNPALVGCFIVSMVIQSTLILLLREPLVADVLYGWGPAFYGNGGFNILRVLVGLSSLCTLAGWAFSNVFHKFDE